jgi:hypothetical protein
MFAAYTHGSNNNYQGHDMRSALIRSFILGWAAFQRQSMYASGQTWSGDLLVF